jgi:hypothetical protein
VREIVVAGDCEHPRAERAQQVRRALEFLSAPAVGQIAGGDNQLRLEPFHEPRQRVLYFSFLMCTRVEIRYMEEPRVHNRTRL